MENDKLENLRHQILDLSKKYFNEKNSINSEFVPHISEIPVTGKFSCPSGYIP